MMSRLPLNRMNSLERTLITKSGYDHGWEVVIEDTGERVILGSALHGAKAEVFDSRGGAGKWLIRFDRAALSREVSRSTTPLVGDGRYLAKSERELGYLLHESARLARALPDAPEVRFTQSVTRELEKQEIISTEVERMIRQRVGQNIYRESLMDYWGRACSVTGIAVPELLRASHAKAWSECDTDADRLNVYNGFLLTAHLDALFDRHLMTFTATGEAIFAPAIDTNIRSQLGITASIKLRWLSPEHERFLTWHRSAFDRSFASSPTITPIPAIFANT